MLNNKQKKYLKQLGHHLKPIFQVGKDGVTAHQIEGILQALEAHELIKVKILDNCLEDKHDIFNEIHLRAHCEIVQIIGRTALLYRPSEDGMITLP